MNKNIVLTLTGHDRVGIVEKITNVIVKLGGNIETSRMARLGGEFAMLALVSLDDKQNSALETDLQILRREGFQVTFLQTEDNHAGKYPGWLPYQIEVMGADHEGIIYEITHFLAQKGINIEEMETTTAPAPMSGAPLFKMQATVFAPPKLSFHAWSNELEEIGDKLNVNIKIDMAK
jgi:glycine cleavage system transcriptional repressor